MGELPDAMLGAIANLCRSAGYTYTILASLRKAVKSTTLSPLRITYLIKIAILLVNLCQYIHQLC
ncbi:hypothetical protein [Nostoc sp.]|uniref:hypothetical protein n=1 Tax=Nostoc sp. TaxID=1180 RepID=UPI002FFA171D